MYSSTSVCPARTEEPSDVIRIYEATDPQHPQPYRVALRLSRVAEFQAESDSGRSPVRLGRLFLETREEALARALSQALYL